jgi:exopolysaccharide biosynthesis protein
MKKIYLLVVFILAVSTFLFWKTINHGNILGIKKKSIEVVTPTPFKMPENTVSVTEGGKTFWATWIKVPDKDKVFLYPNFTEKDSARNLIAKNKCKYLVNGSYYTKDDQPLGLFLSNGLMLKDKTASSLMPGIFFISSDNKEVDITYDLAGKNVRFALQIGPMLIESGKTKNLMIKDDDFARRMVIALTPDKEIIFITIYDSNILFSGPYLSDLPTLLMQFTKTSGISLQKAANLDGGSASAFYTGTFFLEELSYIGSYFCIL